MEHLMLQYQHLHRTPELSARVSRTADTLAKWLSEMGMSVHRLEDDAVIAVLQGKREGKTVALRADMDALPITEQTELPYASETSGVMHACGHDFHMAAVLGAAKLLSQQQDLAGTVQFIFQPDEEADGCAARLAKHPLLKDTVAVFGAHVDPDLPAGSFGFKSGAFYAGAAVFDILFRGRSAHKSEAKRS